MSKQKLTTKIISDYLDDMIEFDAKIELKHNMSIMESSLLSCLHTTGNLIQLQQQIKKVHVDGNEATTKMLNNVTNALENFADFVSKTYKGSNAFREYVWHKEKKEEK